MVSTERCFLDCAFPETIRTCHELSINSEMFIYLKIVKLETWPLLKESFGADKCKIFTFTSVRLLLTLATDKCLQTIFI